MDIGLRLVVENSVFCIIATGFLVVTGWAWRDAKPFALPKPLPDWFKIWFGSVQLLGILPPLAAVVWAIVEGCQSLWQVLAAYFAMLVLQVITEFATLRWFHSVVWVMVPYLYVPYRLWQLWEGLAIAPSTSDYVWLQLLLIGEIIVWGINYLLDLAQLPRLLQWSGATSNTTGQTPM